MIDSFYMQSGQWKHVERNILGYQGCVTTNSIFKEEKRLLSNRCF